MRAIQLLWQALDGLGGRESRRNTAIWYAPKVRNQRAFDPDEGCAETRVVMSQQSHGQFSNSAILPCASAER